MIIKEWVVYISFSSAYTVLLASNSTVSFYWQISCGIMSICPFSSHHWNMVQKNEMNGWTVCRRAYRQQHKQHKPRTQINQKITKTPISPTFPKQALKQDRVCNSQCLKTWHLRILISSFWYLQNLLSIIWH
jgi:hypothetical protein